MPVPLPSAADVDHSRPDAGEARLVAQGIVAAIRPPAGLTPLQDVLVAALAVAMTGHEVEPAALPDLGAAEFAPGGSTPCTPTCSTSRGPRWTTTRRWPGGGQRSRTCRSARWTAASSTSTATAVSSTPGTPVPRHPPLAMIVSLFETGYLAAGAGLLSRPTPGTCRRRAPARGWPTRCAAARCSRAATTSSAPTGSRSPTAPSEAGGITEFQLRAARARAVDEGYEYVPWTPDPAR